MKTMPPVVGDRSVTPGQRARILVVVVAVALTLAWWYW